MTNSEKIKEGLERTYKKLIEFKKYKKTPLIVLKDGEIIELSPDEVNTKKKVYK